MDSLHFNEANLTRQKSFKIIFDENRALRIAKF
jgi:hypothetical protein